jgi:D-aminopeptidase
VLVAAAPGLCEAQREPPRAPARALGVAPGVFRPGPHNAITDVAGVRVGHVTVAEGDSVRTGVTAVLPHAGNLYVDRVPAAVHVANALRTWARRTALAAVKRTAASR